MRLFAVVTNAVVASAVVLFHADCVTPVVPVGREGVPVKACDAIFAFRLSAVCCAVDTGLLASLVLSTFHNPTSAFVTTMVGLFTRRS